MKTNIAILASGSGTNAENITRFFQEKQVANIKIIIANRKDAYVLERARQLKVKAVYIENAEWKEGTNVLKLLKEEKIDFIVLAGFLAKVPSSIIEAFPDRIVNIHPALLPKFGGKGMYGDHVHEAVIAAGEKESGITIHYVNENYDEGTTIAQFKCPVYENDTPEELAQRIHKLEYAHFPEIIEQTIRQLS